MAEFKKGQKYYIEVEVDIERDKDSVWVTHPDHPANEYSGICVYKKNLISKKKLQEEAYHKGHKDGYDAGFAHMWF